VSSSHSFHSLFSKREIKMSVKSSSTTTTRKRPFEILALGLSRSGTDSLCKALEILGYPCYHGWCTLDDPKQSILWAQAIEAKYENKGRPWASEEDFDQILGPYSVRDPE
jgi:hypothetical protein